MNPAIIPIQHAEQFILSGKAILIVHNMNTCNHRKYYIKEWKDSIFYVMYDSETIGKITFREFRVYSTGISHYPAETEGFRRVWQWVLNLTLPNHVQLMHTGVCGYCGRPLTDPESVLRGIGPICRKKIATKRNQF
jgi:hypothetical protein